MIITGAHNLLVMVTVNGLIITMNVNVTLLILTMRKI
jgi:nitrogen fixation protein FixH